MNIKMVLISLIIMWTSQVCAAPWAMDSSTSKLGFFASYEGQEAKGFFKTFDVGLDFDPGHPEQGHLQVVVQTGSADMNSPDINDAIRGPEWFEALKYPQAKFTSTAITSEGPGRYLANGSLTLKGINRRVAVPFLWKSSGGSANMEGELILRRTDFNIGTGEWAGGDIIGINVRLKFQVQLRMVKP